MSFRCPEDQDVLPQIASWGCVQESSTYASLSFAKGPGLGVLKAGGGWP